MLDFFFEPAWAYFPSVSRSQIVRASAARHRRDVTMSVLLLSIVMVFILCNTARVACNLYEAYQASHSHDDDDDDGERESCPVVQVYVLNKVSANFIIIARASFVFKPKPIL